MNLIESWENKQEILSRALGNREIMELLLSLDQGKPTKELEKIFEEISRDLSGGWIRHKKHISRRVRKRLIGAGITGAYKHWHKFPHTAPLENARPYLGHIIASAQLIELRKLSKL
jgi:hypothetical protein